MHQPPESASRLFGHYDPEGLAGGDTDSLVVGRLLEDGGTEDLRWLVASVPEERLARWLIARGGRQLSRRSRAFWQVILDRTAPEPSGVAASLWPL